MKEVVDGQKENSFCEKCKKIVSVTFRTEDYKTKYNDLIPDVMQGFCDTCSDRVTVPPQSAYLLRLYYIKKVEDAHREMGLKMKCPICRTSLVITGQERLESMDEHIMGVEASLKDAFGCPEITCEANKDNIVWDHYGDMYGSNYRKEYAYIDGNYGPFNSDRRASEASDLYKKSHTKHIKFKRLT